jgi:hypothetical protein
MRDSASPAEIRILDLALDRITSYFVRVPESADFPASQALNV